MIGALIGQVVPIIQTVAEVLGGIIPFKTLGGIVVLILLAIVVVLLLCFGAGLLARWSWDKRISERFEKKLQMLVPKYAIFKDLMAGRIGGDETKPRMKPVLARFDDSLFEIERSDTGLVTVYLPGAPDPWAGKIAPLRAERVEPMDIEFGNTVALFEQLGRGSASLLAGKEGESWIKTLNS